MSPKLVARSSPANNEAEFRSSSDDSWYSVLLALVGDKLSVKYCKIDNKPDEVFEAGQFKSVEELKKFQRRFRPLSLQLQDKDCHQVVEGSKVCASYSSIDHDVRFYDAVVEYVTRKNHFFADGKEQCLCSFILLWQHGPHADALMEKKVKNIFVQSNVELNPCVASFVKKARWKIDGAISPSDGAVAASNTSAFYDENGSLSAKQKSPFAQRLKRAKCAKRSPGNIRSDEGKIVDLCESNRQDNDVGGSHNHQYSILIENLDKDLSPSTIIDFIHRQTKITSQVYVFPRLSYELNTRGAIVLDFKKDYECLYKFLNNPNHFVVSLRGRPWVVGKNFSQHDLFKVLSRTLMLTSQKRNAGISHQLRIVRNGTEEYRTAKKLKDLFMEFTSHQERLYKRLALEERRISQPSLQLRCCERNTKCNCCKGGILD